MNEKEVKIMECPFCKSDLEIDIEFAKKNGRVFCGSCCKSFEVKIQEKSVRDRDYDYDGIGYF
jgi:transcription elongation factor Elf1